jgi:4-carboxymuconolactone decarboxylase
MEAHAPRIPPVPPAEWDEAVRPALERLAEGRDRVPNVFTTFARHPGLFRRWLGMGDHLLWRSSLPPREREMVILRTAAVTGSRYEWAHHRVIGAAAGLAEEEIRGIAVGLADSRGAGPLGEDDRTLLEAVDALLAAHDLDDRLWARLAARWSTGQLMDLVATVGFYGLTAMCLKAFRVEVDPGLDDPPGGSR